MSTRPFSYLFRIVVVFLTALLGPVAVSQELPAPQGLATTDVATYTPRKPTDEMLKARKGRNQPTEPVLLAFEWVRPPSVKYALISGCGGGSGGFAAGRDNSGWFAAGSGGAAAAFTSTWIGPLTSGVYKIVLGAGGVGNEPGTDTVLSGADYTIHFEGASSPPHGGIDKTPHGVPAKERSPTVATASELPTPGTSPGSPQAGRPPGGRGDPSPLGPGGEGAAPEMGDKLGAGSPGHDAVGLCAGGGGGSPAAGFGGHGGDGFLRLVPLVDVSVVDEQVKSVIQALSKVQQ